MRRDALSALEDRLGIEIDGTRDLNEVELTDLLTDSKEDDENA